MTRFARAAALICGALMLLLTPACGPSYPDCATDEHCKDQGQYCVNASCKQCRDDSNCGNACTICSTSYSCQRIVGCCQSDADCSPGRCWKDPNNPGVTGTCGGECKAGHPGSQCPDGQICQNGSCVPFCTSDDTCPPGHKCLNGTCVMSQCSLVPVYFDFNESSIRLDQEDRVRTNSECINAANYNVRVQGHCDERGSDEYNLALGQRRANTLVRAYKRFGVKTGINTISYGEERPICNSSNESCWSQNRRAETAAQ